MTIFASSSKLNDDMESFINGYSKLSEILECYNPLLIIKTLKAVLNYHNEDYTISSSINRIVIKLKIDCIKHALNEMDNKFPLEEYPELWI